MAWLRTAAALIGFGFTIVQFFEHLATMKDVGPAMAPHGPTWLGLALIGTGVIALGIASTQYVTSIRRLQGPDFRALAYDAPSKTPGLLLAIVLMLVGLVAFASVLLRAIFLR